MSNINQIIIGTTPTITYTFNAVNPADIQTAILTLVKRGKQTITKTLTDAVVGNDFISWTLEQNDTIFLENGNVEVMLNWVDNNGIRGVGEKASFKLINNHINEVI